MTNLITSVVEELEFTVLLKTCTIDDMTLPTFSDMDNIDAFYIFGTQKKFTFSGASHLCNFETTMALIWHNDLDTDQS